MKKILTIIAMLTMTMAASAQFEAGKGYINASISGLDLSYNGATGGKLNFGAMGGMFVADNWLVDAQLGVTHNGKGDNAHFNIGAGGRYYVQNNGIFLGVNCKVVLSSGYNDVMPGIEGGYCFFLNDKMTLEPSVYYDQSCDNHSEYSTVGLKLALGLYF